MGATFSKAGRTATSTAGRKYPTAGRSRTSAPPPPATQPHASGTKTAGPPPPPPPLPPPKKKLTQKTAIDLDGRDPSFAASLRTLGAVDHTPPTPAHPMASARNPALALLAARSRLAEEAGAEALSAGKKGFPGRRFVDVVTVRQALRLRDGEGVADGEVERRLGLRRGVVGKLGRRGVVGVV
ncbi:hypothetical protein FGG08_005715 [Glutinoglossum americanum]|uniref:Helix-turn-helix domain-containing protein n=1 Tax=Glutinoglossum americanum TaxID=1670608 RepID=A0A9P8HXN1_9PEZI|nr:hypothetical protein FGG08_005715 [Glutinoglossum americanum]